ncbi:DUF4097 family beta strand repeat-containing protein [Kitasatospora sp. NPDC056184]|uniref:DUF4097 family beta strand repeat-containing protein n=1 Tax=Kitasatospora sp. NPDC056184 TaxID=3345738 RepID=UPI0035DFCEDA
MATKQTFSVEGESPVRVHLTSATGRVRVIANPGAEKTSVTVRTADVTGPSVDAVSGSTFHEVAGNNEKTLRIRVPHPMGAVRNAASGSTGGNVYNNTISGGTHFGTIIQRGSVDGVTLSGGQIALNDEKLASSFTSSPSPITVDVFLPQSSSFTLITTEAHLTTRGALKVLEVESVGGSVEADAVSIAFIHTTSGSVGVSSLQEEGDISTIDGDIRIDFYTGRNLGVRSTNGGIRLAAASGASGPVRLATVSGDVVTRGILHLDPTATSVSGEVRHQ